MFTCTQVKVPESLHLYDPEWVLYLKLLQSDSSYLREAHVLHWAKGYENVQYMYVRFKPVWGYWQRPDIGIGVLKTDLCPSYYPHTSHTWSLSRSLGGAPYQGSPGVFPAEKRETPRRLLQACTSSRLAVSPTWKPNSLMWAVKVFICCVQNLIKWLHSADCQGRFGFPTIPISIFEIWLWKLVDEFWPSTVCLSC